MKRSLHSIRVALQALARAVHDLVQAVDDGPAGGSDMAVADALRAHAAEVDGDVAETAAIVQHAIGGESSGDLADAGRSLASAHERFIALHQRVRFGLAGQVTLFGLQRLAGRRDPARRSWSELVLRQIEQIEDALHHVDEAFVASWQEIADFAHRKEIVHA